MPKSKVLLFTNIIAPYRIGLLNKLHEDLGGDLKIYFDSQTETNRHWIIDEKIVFDYEILNSPSISYATRVGNNARMLRSVYFPYKVFLRILKDKPEIVISSELGLRTVFAFLGAKLMGSKIALLSDVTPHSEKNIGSFKKKLRTFLCKRINGGIAHGTMSRKYLEEIGINPTNVSVSPYSTDNEFFDQENIDQGQSEARPNEKDCFHFLYVGQFSELKGLDLLFKVVKDIRCQSDIQIRLTLAGGTRQQLLNLVDSYSESDTNVVGFLQRKEIRTLYKKADCLIFPTRSDTWGLVLNEAIAAGCPVASSIYAGAAADLIDDRSTGYLFDPLNYGEFRNTLLEIIDNRSRLPQMAELARAKLQIHNHHYSAKKIADFIRENAKEFKA